jgi:multidrug resistance efflux pump
MKSDYFHTRSQTSQLKTKREKVKVRQVNWDKLIYMTLLLLALGFLAYFIFTRTVYVTGEGKVIAEVKDVRAPNDIEIIEHYASNRDTVARGDTLFSYSFIDWQKNAEEIERASDRIEQIELEAESVNDQIYLNEQRINEIQSRIQFFKEEKKEFERRVQLDFSTVFELNAVKRDLFNARWQLDQANSELTVLNNNRQRLLNRIDHIQSELQERIAGGHVQHYLAPSGGIVESIHINNYQQAFRSDKILNLRPHTADIYIFSVFNREDAEHLSNGTLLDITFDNGEKSIGRIRDSYDAREDILSHFNQTGSLTTDNIMVELDPVDEATRTQWIRMNRSGLRVQKSKFGTNKRGIQSAYEGLEPAEQGQEDSEHILNSSVPTDTNHKNPDTTDTISRVDDIPKNVPVPDTQTKSEPLSRIDTMQIDIRLSYGLMGEISEKENNGYSIVVHSLENKDTASAIANEIKKMGYRVFVNHQTIINEQVWLISVGQFQNIDDAIAEANSLPESDFKDIFIQRIQ